MLLRLNPRPNPQAKPRSETDSAADMKRRMYEAARRNELLFEALTGEPMPDSLKPK